MLPEVFTGSLAVCSLMAFPAANHHDRCLAWHCRVAQVILAHLRRLPCPEAHHDHIP